MVSVVPSSWCLSLEHCRLLFVVKSPCDCLTEWLDEGARPLVSDGTVQGSSLHPVPCDCLLERGKEPVVFMEQFFSLVTVWLKEEKTVYLYGSAFLSLSLKKERNCLALQNNTLLSFTQTHVTGSLTD